MQLLKQARTAAVICCRHLPDVEMRQGEGQADMQQHHVSRKLCDCVQRVEGEGEEGRGHSCGQLDGQMHLQATHIVCADSLHM